MSALTLVLHLFVPHNTNNHRPKVLHIDALLIYILFFGLLYVGIRSLHNSMPDILGYATDIHVEQLVTATNTKRQAAGLAPLTLDAQLSAAASRKAADMFTKNYWAHNNPEGRTPWEFVTESGYSYVVAGENLAKNFSDSYGVVEAWMASATHRDNLLKESYREVGFAVVNGILNGEETTLVVQMFGARSRAVTSVTRPSPITAPVAAQTEILPGAKQEVTVASAYSGVSVKPLVDISKLNRTIVTVFMAVFLAILALDAWVVSRKRIVRAAGHNIGHILFMVAILLIVGSVQRGSLL